MKAAMIRKFGNLDVVEVGDLPVPKIGPQQVLVKVRAAALNHLDIWVRSGVVPGLDMTKPHILGCDGAGEVAEVGAEVKRWKVGDEVVLNPGISCGRCEFCLRGEQSECEVFRVLGEQVDGTFAEYVAVPEVNVYRKPAHLTWQETAAYPLVFVTAWRMLVNRAQLKPGETVLIPGIGGGVATAALVICNFLGCPAIVTSSSAEKLAKAKQLGAVLGLDYTKEELVPKVREYTQKRGVDVVCDSIGGETWDKHIQCLCKGGRIVNCGATGGPKPVTSLQRVFWNHLTILGTTMGSHHDFAQMHRLVASGKLRPVIDSTFPLAKIKEAQQRMESKGQLGKIVLDIA